MSGTGFTARLEAAFAGAGTVHATCVLVGASGVLIRGASGAGKSRLALALIEEGGRLVADDRVEMARIGAAVIARPPPVLAGLLELRGRGILRLDFEAVARLRLVVDLVRPEAMPRLPAEGERSAEIGGAFLPRLVAATGDPLAPRLVARALAGEAFACDRLALQRGALS